MEIDAEMWKYMIGSIGAWSKVKLKIREGLLII